ncbi:hypothetical protein QN379_02740 [Glaciimonas sp. Gout2]|uniref:hypothetical protein n=1 Tax=unclassified Glaciimonas TaxID=2644401 RepID=UPI002B224322|nr:MULTISPECIES: hypothetical protein [unclassified Glaciimonas]MEB0011282.1 hypothetical protein [Glaciimonas sp. Cout2]MEB0080932.1 hypothetical protein [Glaciimonas sp. Gout2]
MSFFAYLDQQNKNGVSKPFNSLRDIRWRAERILKYKNRTPEELESAAQAIQDCISEFKNEKIAEEIERHITRLHNEGGWELGYLPDYENDRQPGMDEIRKLLENWPYWAKDRPDVPDEENIYDLYALGDIMSSGFHFDDIAGFSEASEAECYAVLALMRLDDALSLVSVPEKKNENGTVIHSGVFPWKGQSVIDAGNLIVEAMEIVCCAENQLSYDHLTKLREEQRQKMDAEREAIKAAKINFSVIGRDGGIKRNAPMAKLRTWAVDLYRQGDWSSANKAAHELKSRVVEYGRTINANLAEQNAQRTIAEWFRKSV